MSECAVCLQSFDGTLRIPKILSCFHTFCRICLIELIKHNQMNGLKCPTCNTPHNNSSITNVDQLANNFALLPLVPTHPILPPNAICSICNDEEKCVVTSYCFECDQYLCALMQSVHQKMKCTTSHCLIPYTTTSTSSDSTSLSQTPTPISSSTSPRPQCQLSLHYSEESPSLLRFQVQLPLPSPSHLLKRTKVVLLLLDRSGSMKNDWETVCQSVQTVIKKKIAPGTLLRILVYSDTSQLLDLNENKLGSLPEVLSLNKPTNQLTVFRSAFRLAQQVISDIMKVPNLHPEFTILLFTDGCDTSIWENGKLNPNKSEASARKFFDNFRSYLNTIQRPVFIYVAAFTSAHSPSQCTYFSDRYRYIDRPITLDRDLQDVVGEMMTGTGHCTLTFDIPKEYELLEPIPHLLPLQPSPYLTHHFWLNCKNAISQNKMSQSKIPHITGMLEIIGSEPIEFTNNSSPQLISGEFQTHIFRVQRAAYTLRAASRRVPNFPTDEFIGELKVLLASQRVELLKSRRAVCAPLHGVGSFQEAVEWITAAKDAGFQLEEKIYLRKEIESCDVLFDRLSHVVRVYDEKSFNCVQIQAILKDSCQHLPSQNLPPSSPSKTDTSTIQNALSPFAMEFAKDFITNKNATTLLNGDDSLFFDIERVTILPLHSTRASACEGLCSYEGFCFLSETSKRLKKPIELKGRKISTIWLPLYLHPAHFSVAIDRLPAALTNLKNQSEDEVKSELGSILFRTFGQIVISSTVESPLFVHCLRSLYATAEHSRQIDSPLTLLEASDNRLKSFCNGMIANPNVLLPQWELFSDLLLHFISPSIRTFIIERLLLLIITQAVSTHTASNFDFSDTSIANCASSALTFSTNNSPTVSETVRFITIFLQVQSIYDQMNSSPQTFFQLIDRTVLDQNEVEKFHVIVNNLPFAFTISDVVLGAFVQLRIHKSQKQEQEWKSLIENSASFVIQRCWHRHRNQSTTFSVWRSLRWLQPLRFPETVIYVSIRTQNLRRAAEIAAAKIAQEDMMKMRRQLIREHPIHAQLQVKKCFCGKYFTHSHALQVWGKEAQPDDKDLYEKCVKQVLEERCYLKFKNYHSMKDALAIKKYYLAGGYFHFEFGDTMIRGLHERVDSLWKNERSNFSTTDEAVSELLLRVKYDSRVPGATDLLKKILIFLWESRNGGPKVSKILSTIDPSFL
jgi:hypothetical protein